MKYIKIYTTAYIDYSISDLLKIDGVLSQYEDEVVSSQDERDIINYLFNQYFIKDSNFSKIVQKSLLESLATNSKGETNLSFIDKFITTNIYSNTLVGNVSCCDYLIANGNTTLNAYLSKNELTLNEKLILASINDKDLFVNIVTYCLNNITSKQFTEEQLQMIKDYEALIDYVNKNDDSIDSDGNFIASNLGNAPNAEEVYKNFSISDSTSLTSISSLSNITGTNLTGIISETDYLSEHYKYGISFSTLTITNVSSYQGITILAKSLNNPSTLSYSTSSTGTSGNVTITDISEYSISFSGEQSISFSCSSQDVVIYEIYAIKSLSPTSKTINSSTMTVSTLDEIKNLIGSNSIEVISVQLNATVKNSTTGLWSNRYLAIYNSENKLSPTSGILGNNSTADLSFDITNNLGDLLTVMGSYTADGAFASSTYYTITQYSYTITYYQVDDGLINNSDIATSIYKNTDLSSYNYKIISNDYLSTKKDSFTVDSLMYLLPLNNSNNDKINEMLKNLYGNIISSSNDELIKFIKSLNLSLSNLQEVIDIIVTDDSRHVASLIDKYNTGILNEDTNDIILAANIATDYNLVYNASLVSNNINVSSTIINSILGMFSQDTQYITSDGTFDYTKYDNMMSLLGIALITEGYGIFALSSSKGILNGQFIPDNISLASMNANYKYSSDDSYFEITEDESDDWMMGTSSTTATSDSIYNKVTTEMKQLKKSIATTVFELQLTDGDNTIYSSTELIDLDNNIIYLYIPSGYTNTFRLNNISDIVKSDLATIEISSNFAISLSNNNQTFIVRAEDTSVFSEYTVILVPYDTTTSFVSSKGDKDLSVITSNATEANVSASNGTLNIILSTTLPVGFDFTRYISLYTGSSAASGVLTSGMYTLASDPFVEEYDGTNRVLISLNISENLTYGSNCVTVSIFGTVINIPFNKAANTGASLDIEYEGVNVLFTQSGTTFSATTYIEFGRVFTELNFLDIESDDFYLSDISYSSGATVNARYSITTTGTNSNSIYSNGIVTYMVVFTVISEDQNITYTYTHYLVENSPFKMNGTKYDDTYISVANNGEGITPTYDDLSNITLSFGRDDSASYRLTYALANFYYNSSIGNYLSLSLSNDAEFNEAYVTYAVNGSGGVLNFEQGTTPGVYTFTLTYKYEYSYIYGEDNKTFTRIYDFPSIQVTCNYSTDSLLNKITFYESSAVISGVSTVVNNQVLRPIDTNLEANEVAYRTYWDDNTKSIIVNSGTISYANETDKNSNFYVVGSVSGAQLVNYSPIFGFSEHSKIYQYTTEKKIRGYGSSQTSTDTTLLNTTNSEVLYLIVPFTSLVNDVEIEENFVVECSKNVWSNVYTTDILTSGSNFDTVKSNTIGVYDKVSSSFTYNNITYKVSSNAGLSTNNISLYMDYIGTPASDHFWYVSYVIFSEDAQYNTNSNNVKFYHIALIDATNTIYYNISIKSNEDLGDSIYLTIVDYYFSSDLNNQVTCDIYNISAFFTEKTSETVDGVTTYTYTTLVNLQVLPRGYFYFYLSLPEGYTCGYDIITKNKENNIIYEGGKETTASGNKISISTDDTYAYLPPSSIVTQTIDVTLTISKSDSGIIWGEANDTFYVHEATYDGEYRKKTE